MKTLRFLGLAVALAVTTALLRCSSEAGPANFDAAQLQRLLAADSAKTWVLNSRTQGLTLQDCETDDQLIFRLSTGSEDTITVNFETGAVFCPGQTDSLIFQGVWEIVDGALQDSLQLVVNGDTTLRSIDFITSQQLGLTYQDLGQTISETYINK